MEYCCFTVPGTIIFLGLIYCFPTFPIFSNSIIRANSVWLKLTLVITDAYIFPVSLAIISTANLITCMTFGSMKIGVQSLKAAFKTESDCEKHLAVNRAYTCYQVIIDSLTSVFSVSFLFQEGLFLITIVTLLAFGVKNSGNRRMTIILEITIYFGALQGSFLVISQFFPVIMLYIHSNETLKLMTTFMRTDKHARAMARRSRLLKVRPMNVHTITLETLFDYVIFIVSVLLMLLQA